MKARIRNSHWLDRYGSSKYKWQSFTQRGQTTFYRPLGLVESFFDTDGRYYEGRADVNCRLDLEVKSTLDKHDFRERILFAWAVLRCQHLLLQSRAVSGDKLRVDDHSMASIFFAINPQQSISHAVENAAKHLMFLGDHFQELNSSDFYVHCQNTARVIDPSVALARLFVSMEPLEQEGHRTVRLLLVGAHQIWDGLTIGLWMRDLLRLLNQPLAELRKHLIKAMEPNDILSRLPPPQEALYPHITGSRARQRWFWLLTRILRHVRKPLPAGFTNPLRRRHPRATAIPLSPSYASVLDYSVTPPVSSFPRRASIQQSGVQRLHRLCREAGASIGAGCFALVALIGMEMYGRQEPHIPLIERRPFISGFPVNPRAFVDYHVEPDSLMLSFCDGIALPFLSSDLDIDGRIRLLARQAHRQLATYQKRPRLDSDEKRLEFMGSRGPGRNLAIQYLWSVERMDQMLPEELREGINPQGAYPTRPNSTVQTHGVSSVGRKDGSLKPGLYNLDGERDFIADCRQQFGAVRPRDNEFLVAIGGDDAHLAATINIDGNSIDPVLVEQWCRRFETILDEDEPSRPSKL